MAKSPQHPGRVDRLGSGRAQTSSDPASGRPSGRPLDRRIRWLSRRGLLELDILLNHFLQTDYSTLSTTNKEKLLLMLQTPDVALWRAVTGMEPTPDMDGSLLAALRQCLNTSAVAPVCHEAHPTAIREE